MQLNTVVLSKYKNDPDIERAYSGLLTDKRRNDIIDGFRRNQSIDSDTHGNKGNNDGKITMSEIRSRILTHYNKGEDERG